MKEIMAIVRINMMNKTKQALADAGISSITARDALGRGKGLVDMTILEGAEKGYEEAIALARRLIDSKDIISLPYLSGQHNFLAFSYFKKGMYEEAVIENDKAWALVRSSPESTILCGIGHVYGLLGKKEKALKILDQMQALSSQRYVDPVYFAAVYAGLGDNDTAFEWLEKAYKRHSPTLIYLKGWWVLENLRSDSRSIELLKKIGLE